MSQNARKKASDLQTLQKFKRIIPEFRRRIRQVIEASKEAKAVDRLTEVGKALGIGRTSLRNLIDLNPTSPHILVTILHQHQMNAEQNANLMIEDVHAFVFHQNSRNPYTQALLFLQQAPLPCDSYLERKRLKQSFGSFLTTPSRRILNIYGDQGTGRTQLIAREIQRLVESPRIYDMFPNGIGYYNLNPANASDHQTRRNFLANTVQTLISLFSLPEDETQQEKAIIRELRGKRFLLVMENVPDAAYGDMLRLWLNDAHQSSKLVLISVAPLELHNTSKLRVPPFTTQEAQGYLKLFSPALIKHLDAVEKITELRPKHLDVLCSLMTIEKERDPSAAEDLIVFRAIQALSTRLRTNLNDRHHLDVLNDESYTLLPYLAITRQPISVDCAAALWDMPPQKAENLLNQFVHESWLRKTEYTGGTFAFHFVERELAAGVLSNHADSERQARLRLAAYLTNKCLAIEHTWHGAGAEAVDALKRFAQIREDFWSTLRDLAVDGRMHLHSCEAYFRLFGSCPEVLFQMFSFGRRRELDTTTRELALCQESSSTARKKALYVAKWFASFEKYVADLFHLADQLVSDRLLLARDLEDPQLICFALIDRIRNRVRIAVSDGRPIADCLSALEELKEAIGRHNVGTRLKCYQLFIEGWMMHQFERHDEAQSCLVEAKAIADQRQDYRVIGRCLITLSRSMRRGGDLVGAENKGLEAFHYAEDTGQNELLALAARNLSRIYESREHFNEAAKYERRWYDWKESENHPTRHITRARLGRLISLSNAVQGNAFAPEI